MALLTEPDVWDAFDDIRGFALEICYRKYKESNKYEKYRFCDLGETTVDLDDMIEFMTLEPDQRWWVKRQDDEADDGQWIKKRANKSTRFNNFSNFN